MSRRAQHVVLSTTLALFGLALAFSLPAWRDRHLPRHDGRTAREWFTRFHLERARDQEGSPRSARLFDCQDAFLAMGTNAVPFLIERVFDYRPDPPLRSRLREFNRRQLPDWAGRDLFPPHWLANEAAWELLRDQRPPASLVLPLILPRLQGTNTFMRRPALAVLGTVGDGGDQAADLAVTQFTNSTDLTLRLMALEALARLGSAASNALPFLLQDPPGPQTARPIGLLASRLGTNATRAIPWLETLLTDTNSTRRIHAALALVSIESQHPAAWGVIHAAAQATPVPENPRPGPRETSPRLALCRTIRSLALRPTPQWEALLEPLFRDEAEAWSEAGAGYEVADAMEQVAPDRARSILLELTRDPTRWHAAARLLRLQPDHASAAAALIAACEADSRRRLPILEFLSAASSSNSVAIPFLQSCAASKALPAEERDAAATALARIRHRENRVAHGLPGQDW
ncbi:MAG: hypothetical protein IT580_11865 [Verrucomicrobiales bacterium]|nr:hypothetical protein [Verrucomicrobiales bacterium]